MAGSGDLFAGGGAAGALMAGLDWGATPVGPVERWPQSLRAAVRIVLSSRYPMLLLWGEELTQLYNDAYSQLIGDQHPAAMGIDVRVTLAAGWDALGPLIDEAMATGVATWVPALQLLLERAGYREEAYFSVSHAPARDDDGRTVGVFTVCSEVTEQVVGERRLRLLRDLSLRAGATRTVASTAADLGEAVGGHPLDVPFAALYVRDGLALRRVALVGDVGAAVPAEVALDGGTDAWGLREAAAGHPGQVGDVAARVRVPSGAWGDPAREALALPLPSADRDQPLGVLLAGVSASRALDDGYRSFFELLAQQASVALRNARAHEEERARAEALAELDRVKTVFFTSVSHEFRTPLTLMLGPLADALDDAAHPLEGVQRERVETARRNALRLQGLVDDLLTFSSVEAGRAHQHRVVVDLAALTAELASAFRAAVERAGLRLDVDCPPLPRPVALDPASWEKVVANLLSNALKFTFVGRIGVALRGDDDAVRLQVSDTGIGVPVEEQERLFDRFHRVAGARSRSHEGSGIGLALVRELSRLQGGDVRLESTAGEGTTFTVELPWSALDPAGAAADVADAPELGRTAAAVAAAAQWAGPTGAAHREPDPPPDAQDEPVRVLVVDDNADMRAYLQRLLTDQGWAVEAAEDGQAALDAVARRAPDVVLTDVMMPRVDGFELVRALRRGPATRALPVVVLSARAGQEASVEGLELGADDYVVKPFTASELVARLRTTTVALARLRSAHREQLDALADTAAVITSGRALEEAVLGIAEQARAALGASAATAALDDGTRAPLTFTAPAGAPPVAPGTGTDGVRPADVSLSYPSTPRAAAAVRRDLRRHLREAGVGDAVVFELLVACSEAVNNAVEHSQAPDRAEVEVRLTVRPDLVRIVVQDFGSWRQRQPAMDRGRGSALMSAYAEVRVDSTATGTAVTLERALGAG